ncbi:MAG TPA: ABC transporter ATP-binding protein [Patescibacteria group bacterium]|nr:ABC transporter ATP-binding protein [Patescibacteria group bacterium]
MLKNRASVKDILGLFFRHIRPYRLLTISIFLSILVGQTFVMFQPWASKRFFDLLTQTSPQDASLLPALLWTVGLLFLLQGGRWLFFQGAGLLNNRFQTQIMADLERNAFAYLLQHSYGFFSNAFSGSLVRKIRRLSRSFEDLSDTVEWSFLPVIVTVIGAVLGLGLRSPLLAVCAGAWIVLFTTASYFFSRWKLRYDERRAETDSEVTATLADAVTNHTNILVFTGREEERRRFSNVTEQYRRLQVFTWDLSTANEAFQWGMAILLETVVLLLAVRLWIQGEITIGDIALFQGYLYAIFERTWDLGRAIRRTYEALADASEMTATLKIPHEIQDAKTAKDLKVKGGAISFQDVAFNYHQTREILRQFNLEIKPGEKVAVVGSSGAGKSTLVKLLFRFYDADGGKILIDGQNVARVSQDSLRSQMALVSQEPILFHRTLLDNIRYGRPDASETEIIRAAQKAHCHEFIEALPEKYETHVGERGIKLSGGERQRVAIARAILKDAPILILDEATSSLDSKSEQLIQDALTELMKKKTVLVIAHRLSTILKMDRIVVMDQGHVVDQGTHRELLQRGGLYKTLWDIQVGGFLGGIKEAEEEKVK